MKEELQLENEIKFHKEVDKEIVVDGSGANIDANDVNENVDYAIKEYQQQEIGDEDEDDNDDDNDDEADEEDEEDDEDEYYKFDINNHRKCISRSDAMKYTYIVVNRIYRAKG